MDTYILSKSGVPIRATIEEWGKFVENRANKIVSRQTVGDCDISTVFLGIDHNWTKEGPPILWETMVFGGTLDQEETRCSGSKEQAEAMHEEMVRKVRKQQKLEK